MKNAMTVKVFWEGDMLVNPKEADHVYVVERVYENGDLRVRIHPPEARNTATTIEKKYLHNYSVLEVGDLDTPRYSSLVNKALASKKARETIKSREAAKARSTDLEEFASRDDLW